MSGINRHVYIISDLHLGGDYPPPDKIGARGFRLCTHAKSIQLFVNSLVRELTLGESIELILNGDTVDFLAEREPGSDVWSSFTADPQDSVTKFNTIVARDRNVFESLHTFLDHGGRLVILLGNHDIELSLPNVRAALHRALGVKGKHDFEFIYDGEAYVVADALIEHGNRYDAWNQVDHDSLRRLRSLLSRRQGVPTEYRFDPPAGSKMVATVINPIKESYPFIDLLKPEQETVVPMLLALEPSYRSRIVAIARLLYSTSDHGIRRADLPAWGGDIGSDTRSEIAGLIGDSISAIASSNNSIAVSDDQVLRQLLDPLLGKETPRFLKDTEPSKSKPRSVEFGSEIGSMETASRVLGFIELLAGRNSAAAVKRLPALLKAMRCVQNKDASATDKETLPEYLNAAREISRRGFKYVIFGHTHRAKYIDLGNGSYYLNSGTWADILQFPTGILSLPKAEALAELQAFVGYMRAGDFSQFDTFAPTYVKLELEQSDVVARATICTFYQPAPPGKTS